MSTRFKQWGATLVVLGGASLVLPMIGIQLRIFSAFGAAQKSAGIAALVLGTVLWLVGSARHRPVEASAGAGPGAPPLPPPAPPSGSAPTPPSQGYLTCPKCGTKSSASDRFCIECGTPLPQTAAAPVAPSPAPVATPVAAPRRRRKIGRKILLGLFLLLIGGIAWFFLGPSKSYKPPVRSEPAVPPQMAGTLTEFPLDSATTNKMQPTDVISQVFEPPAQSGSPPVLGTPSTPSLQAPPETFPPGLDTKMIPPVTSAMTSSTYRSDPQSAPVYVCVLQVGPNTAMAGDFARGVAQSSGGALQGARVQSPQGQTYEGYTVRSGTIMVYILTNPNAGNIIMLYTPQPAGFPALQRLAGSVGNGRGLRDNPQIADTYGALPAQPPPGYRMTGMRNFSGSQLLGALGKTEGKLGKDNAAELSRLIESIRVILPEHGTMATYKDARGQEKGIIVGNYGSGRKSSVAWRALAWTLGWGMKKDKVSGFDALVTKDQESRIMLFQKGPYIGMAKVPGASSEQELRDLAASLQF
jgi:hypothetical protein